ncbi:hypothetical protein [Chryseobacterium sp. 18068]|uniref:hypothetical protein n=1 Tax=Chryseobacterium sp. 18068 TaxID=2681414 RepID=UPI00135870D2|nr:hypothetical protein [Chryseobacterium sp. 18068]
MLEKLYRVERQNVDFDKTYDTNDSNYGKNFDFKNHNIFLNSYLQIMKVNDISVDFLVEINNNIYSMGDIYLEKIENAIVTGDFIDIYQVTGNDKHQNQKIHIKWINYFIKSLDENNGFKEFYNGSYLWEFILEFVRCNLFKNAPNRLNSVFFFNDIDSCDYYIKKHLNGIGRKFEIETIQPTNHFKGDMKIIDNIENQIMFEDLFNEFADYWRGKMVSDPIEEIIYQGTYKYTKAV